MKRFKETLLVIVWTIKKSLLINKKVFTFWFLVCLFISLLPSLSLMCQQILYSDIIKGNNTEEVVYKIAILFLLMTINCIAAKIDQDYLQMILYETFDLGMEECVINAINSIPIEWSFNKDIMDQYRYVKYRYTAFNSLITGLFMSVKSIVNIVFLLTLIFILSKDVFVFALVFTFLCLAINMFTAKKTCFDYLVYRDSEIKTKNIEESTMLQGVAKEIRLFGTKNCVLNNWKEAYMPIFEMEKRIGIWRFVDSATCGSMYYLFSVGVLLYSIEQLWTGRMTLDVLIVLYSTLRTTSQAIVQISSSMQRLNRDIKDMSNIISALACIQENGRVEARCSREKEILTDAIICLKNIQFSYFEKEWCINDISLSIYEGETIALLGENGSGKTTLVNIILGIFRPINGEIFYRGKSYSEYEENDLLSRFGVFFQSGKLFHASIRENIGFGSIKEYSDEKKVAKAMKKGRFECKYDWNQWILKDVNKSGLILSGGEEQKIGISRAYMGEKEIYIFDEPSSALDPVAEHEQLVEIERNKREKTIILVSHRVGYARLADRIVVMKKGQIVEIGTHDELMGKRGFYYEMFQKQANCYMSEEKRNYINYNESN